MCKGNKISAAEFPFLLVVQKTTKFTHIHGNIHTYTYYVQRIIAFSEQNTKKCFQKAESLMRLQVTE